MTPQALQTIEAQWQAAWPEALAAWSPYVQLHEPLWCHTIRAEKSAGLSGSFAMIRLVDHSVVISVRQIAERGLEKFAVPILAHEIGHHVLCPADLTDNARLLARIRRGLPGVEMYAPMISNLYADLLINDRLQRSAGLDIAGVYQKLDNDTDSKLWQLYMRTYELLWNLPPNTFVKTKIDERTNQDAQLGARLVRSYARDWLGGGGRFACLCFPYVEQDKDVCEKAGRVWWDTVSAGQGGIPHGLADMDDGEPDECIHPAEDPALSGISNANPNGSSRGRVDSINSGRKTFKDSRGPLEYSEILKATGLNLSPREIAIRYYRERATPHLIPFPTRKAHHAFDPLPEGLDLWEVSSPLERIDWLATLLDSPHVIPGVTTRERIMGESPGNEPERIPLDLYIGVDCSGSMSDPATYLSYPILAGAVMVMSALRAGARVKVVLSGEPGNSIATDGFIRDAHGCLQLLTNYLGTGYAFGIHRLAETFDEQFETSRPVHVLVISDTDMFSMLDSDADGRLGWEVARQAVERCGGGATYVLQIHGGMSENNLRMPQLARMQAEGWNVHLVDSMEELIAFARKFTRQRYAGET